ncbi:MAG: preprotein translocase subunit SecG [Parcubacteria group bacterium]|nr:preprotein translocase subunit SecG [Parcubacteria group bacterium]
MSRVFAVIQIIISVLLVAAVMIQNKGVGLSQTFGGGGGGGEGNTYSTKRGAEKIVFITTIILAIVFLALAFAHLFV